MNFDNVYVVSAMLYLLNQEADSEKPSVYYQSIIWYQFLVLLQSYQYGQATVSLFWIDILLHQNVNKCIVLLDLYTFHICMDSSQQQPSYDKDIEPFHLHEKYVRLNLR
jgi:hypothetical protein